jgi:hypothetical protein
MSNANMSGANMTDAILSGANMSNAILSGANMYGANMTCANMTDANMSGTNMSRADLSRTNMSSAIMYGANMYGANMYGANLYGARGLKYASCCFDWHGERGRMLTAVRIGDEDVYFCGCFRGSISDLRKYIAEGLEEYRYSRTIAADFVDACMGARR